jgi:3-hydroxyisobutyrate dehydrogenase-like beta-hydroxyacid dehydrogenase
VANVVKVAVNYNIIHAIQAMGETVGMTERHGVDPAEFVELLSSTLFGGVVYGGYGAMIAQGTYSPAGFAIELGAKDHRLAEEVAAEVGLTLPTAPAIRAGFDAALAHPELKDYDWGALAESTRRGLLDGAHEGDEHD